MDIENIMEICSEALEQAGYIISDYSEAYENFTVSKDKRRSISVDFKKIE